MGTEVVITTFLKRYPLLAMITNSAVKLSAQTLFTVLFRPLTQQCLAHSLVLAK